MEMVFGGIVAVLLGVIIFLQIRARKAEPSGDNGLADISRRIDEMNRAVNETALKQSESMSKRIDDINKSMNDNAIKSNESVHQQFEKSQKIVADITEKLTKFEATNKSVLEATDKLEDLQRILLNPKHRGGFGEFQLGAMLDNFFPPNQWQAQYKFKNGDTVDAALFLQDGKILPIDSKFSLENYNRMAAEKSAERKKTLVHEVRKDLKNRVDETAKYIRASENTMDFAFMFIPSEALYYDMLIAKVGSGSGNERDLIEYAFRDKHVIIVSPTTFVAYLQTVLQGLRSLQIEEQAKDIQKWVRELGVHLQKYNVYVEKLGNSLATTVNHYNNSQKELKKVDRSAAKITSGEEKLPEPAALDGPAGE